MIAQAYVKKALDWPSIKPESAKALGAFGIFLKECLFANENIFGIFRKFEILGKEITLLSS
jgi:hypothetical protein